MPAIPCVTSQGDDDFSRLGAIEAGLPLEQGSHISQECIVMEHLQLSSTVQERLISVTSQPISSKAENVNSKRSQAEESDEAWAVVYATMENESYENHPNGWPRLASFIDGCDSFSIFRRFGHCATWILVNYTARITMLEKELRDLDRSDALPDGKTYRLRNPEQGSDTVKEDLLNELEHLLRRYYKLFLQYSQVRGLGQAPETDHDSVFSWIHCNKPVDEGYYEWIQHSKDFVSAVPPKQNTIEDFVWKCLTLRPTGWLMRYLGYEKQDKQPKEETVRYLSEGRIVVVARLVAVVLAVVVLFTPIALFLLVPMSKACMCAILFVFLMVFAVMISLFAEVGIQEIFIGTATYGAVMVTFLGNLQNVAPPATS